MRKYLYRKLREYLDLYVRPGDRIAEIDARETAERLKFQDHELLVLPGTSQQIGQPRVNLEALAEFRADYVLLNGNIHYEADVQDFLEKLRLALLPSTRVIITFYSTLWKPVLRLATALGVRAKTPEENWIASEDVRSLLLLANYELVQQESKFLVPIYIPLISYLANRFLAPLPGFRQLNLLNIAVARPIGLSAPDRSKAPSVSVVVPARNEAGNIEAAILRTPRMGPDDELIFIEGNSAAALGAVYGGATVCAWYPITPSSSLADAFTGHCRRLRVDPVTKKNKVAIVQAEDELASIGMVIGAAWNGARAFTATSGPGISLMQEFLGLAYFAEIPAVIFDVQRAGPSTGMPTRTQQCDLISCAYASHGDTKHVLLFPENPTEAFEFGAQAFDLADRLQAPVFVMLDLDIGMNHHLCRPLKWDDSHKYDRGKVMTAADLDAGKEFGRYLDVDGDGIPYRTYPGTHPTKGSFFTRGTSRDRYARYSEEGSVYADNMQRLVRKFETAQDMVPRPLQANAARPTKYGVIYFGSTAPAMDEAIGILEARGHELDRLRIRAFPFHSSVASFVADHDFVYVIEQNRDAQLRSLIVNENGIDPVRLVPILHFDGTPITARFIAGAIGDHQDQLKLTPLRKVVS